MSNKLTSIPTLVESPFIIATIGGITFGSYVANGVNGYGLNDKVTYPNFMKSLSINKVNGTVNTYTLVFSYQVRPGEDPNLLDKIFSKAVKDRKIVLQYGDWNAPTYIYKEEHCIITGVTSSLNMNNASIDYTVQCTSDAIGLTSTSFSFGAMEAKPSDIIFQLLSNSKYGLTKVFEGMTDKAKILANNLIATNDKVVKLLAQKDVSVISYLTYLVNCMCNCNNTSLNGVTNSRYFLTIHDDYTNMLGGAYFKITEIMNSTQDVVSADTYEIDVNYPQDNFVTQFSLSNDQSWAILYEYGAEVNQEQYTYNITDEGTVETVYSPALLRSSNNEISPAKVSWWTKMTQFPVKATLTIKGLVRPSILMSYVRLNVLFSGGVKHLSSGLYVITKQTDTIDASGYKTTLELLRVGGDYFNIQSVERTAYTSSPELLRAGGEVI